MVEDSNPEIVPLILALCTGVFPYRTEASDSLATALRNSCSADERYRDKLRAFYQRSKIQERFLAIPDFSGISQKNVFTGSFDMPIDKRLQKAQEISAPLVRDVAERALRDAEVAPEDVSQLVFVTSTTLGSPGLDQELVRSLGLPRTVMRACVNYAGCAAGITGLHWAYDHVRGLRSDQSHLVSLVVCLETSSLHATLNHDQNHVITHSLFADGVACLVVGRRPNSSPDMVGKLAIRDFESLLLDNMDKGIQLRIRENAIECLLSPRLPEAISMGIDKWMDILCKRLELERADIAFWAIHPGGRKIIEKSIEGLALPEAAARFSWETLRGYGNVLSCGVFFVLRQILDSGEFSPGDQGIAFSFSPGVSIEGVMLQMLPVREAVPASTTQMRVKKTYGAVVPDWAPDDLVEALDGLDKRADDITVATYPKAGTTWVLQIAHLLINGGQQGDRALNEAVGWFERDRISKLNATIGRRIIKTHLPVGMFPITGKCIYVARNPKDLAVSYYYHARAKEDFGFLGNWEHFLDLFLAGNVEGGDWWEHTYQGLLTARANPQKVLFLWYEEMQRDTQSAIEQIGSFIGLDIKRPLINAVLSKSSLEYMRNSRFTNVKWSRERFGEAPHLRRGAVGGWRDLFNRKQEQRLEAKWLDKAGKEGVRLPMEPEDTYIVCCSEQLSAVTEIVRPHLKLVR